jgi:glucokinase
MFLGIEIGGTKLQLGIGPGDGSIRALERVKADAAAGADRIRQQIRESVPRLLTRAGVERSDVRGVAIGFGGPVDTQRGIVTKSHQVEGWSEFPLAEWSQRELGWPTVIHNDADTAGLAEACFGAGRGLSPIFYVTIGSGIGGGLIIDQKIYRGFGAGASEIGHLQFFDDGLMYGTTLESVCSGWSIGQRLRPRVQRELDGHGDGISLHDARHLLRLADNNLQGVTTEVIAQAAREGNKMAIEHLRQWIDALAWGISQMITLLAPRRVVIGGGVSLIGNDLLFDPLRLAVERIGFKPFVGQYDIVPAALGEPVVVQGALRLARDAAAGA